MWKYFGFAIKLEVFAFVYWISLNYFWMKKFQDVSLEVEMNKNPSSHFWRFFFFNVIRWYCLLIFVHDLNFQTYTFIPSYLLLEKSVAPALMVTNFMLSTEHQEYQFNLYCCAYEAICLRTQSIVGMVWIFFFFFFLLRNDAIETVRFMCWCGCFFQFHSDNAGKSIDRYYSYIVSYLLTSLAMGNKMEICCCCCCCCWCR